MSLTLWFQNRKIPFIHRTVSESLPNSTLKLCSETSGQMEGNISGLSSAGRILWGVAYTFAIIKMIKIGIASKYFGPIILSINAMMMDIFMVSNFTHPLLVPQQFYTQCCLSPVCCSLFTVTLFQHTNSQIKLIKIK